MRQAGNNIFCKNSLRLNVDDLEVSVGVDNDLKAYHDGSHSWVVNGTGNLYIKGSSGADVRFLDNSNNNMISATAGGQVQLYYNASEKFKTTNDGTVTTGISTATSFTDSKGDLRSIPVNSQSGAYVLVAADAGKAVYISTGGVTINTSLFATGDAVTIINNSGSTQTITQGSGFTLYDTGDDGSTGNKTLKARGMCTVWFISAGGGYISGNFD